MFGWEFPPHNSGGLGVACKGIVDALCSQGTSVSFVLPKRIPLDPSTKNIHFADNSPALLNTKGVDVLLVPYATSQSYIDYRKEAIKKAKRKGKNFSKYAGTLVGEVYRYGALVADIAESEDYDVIHAHDWLSFEAGITAKEISGKPFVAHVHATEFDRSGERVNQDIYDIERRGVHMADRVVTVSNHTKNIIMDRYGVPEQKISVVHNGICEQDYTEVIEDSSAQMITRLKENGYKIVLFLGRITFQKGPDYFVKMAKKVLAASR